MICNLVIFPLEKGMTNNGDNIEFRLSNDALCAEVGCNWSKGSGKEGLKICHCILISLLSPSKWLWTFMWTNLNPFLVEIGHSALEKKSLIYRQCIFALYYCLPDEKGVADLNPLPERCLLLFWSWPSGSEEEVKQLESLQRDVRQLVLRKTNVSTHGP